MSRYPVRLPQFRTDLECIWNGLSQLCPIIVFVPDWSNFWCSRYYPWTSWIFKFFLKKWHDEWRRRRLMTTSDDQWWQHQIWTTLTSHRPTTPSIAPWAPLSLLSSSLVLNCWFSSSHSMCITTVSMIETNCREQPLFLLIHLRGITWWIIGTCHPFCWWVD